MKIKNLIPLIFCAISIAGCGGSNSNSSSNTTNPNAFNTTDNNNNTNNSVNFGPNVIIGNPNDSSLQGQILNIYNQMWSEGTSQFSSNRYAILLKPGTYNNLDVRVGYYTQVLGLGTQPDDVHIIGAVRTRDGTPYDPSHPDQSPGALNNFWRGAENLSITPTLGSIDYDSSIVPLNQNVWAVSQASPLRRIHIQDGVLRLFDIGYSSGGFMANILADQDVITGSQQQWFTRNTTWLNDWQPGNWNMVFAGSSGKACFWGPGGWQNNDLVCTFNMPTSGVVESHPFIAIGQVPAVSEKPFLTIDSNDNYSVHVPPLKTNSNGNDFTTTNDKILPISSFFIAYPTTTTSAINSALQSGKNLILTPGVYNLDNTIVIPNKDQVVLGLGIPTLVAPGTGIPAIQINDVDGVKLAGIMVDANIETGALPTLIQVGSKNAAHSTDPIELYDIYCRIGGAVAGNAGNCMTINSNNVIADNLWLWRADHGNGVGWTTNSANNGLIVNGDNVTIYGLAVEHFNQYQTIWNGENGKVMFYQSEAPYDVPNQAAWNPPSSPSTNGYASYLVNATSHTAYGLGIYSNFIVANIVLDNAILTPNIPSTTALQQTFTVWLNGITGSQISHVINNLGPSATSNTPGTPQYYN